MKKIYLISTLILSILSLNAQTTWKKYASTVIAYSSQWSTPDYSALQSLGAPNANTCSDDVHAWASSSADGNREFLVLGFDNPSKTTRVRIFQNLAPGAIDTVYLRDASTGTWHQIYSATASAKVCSSADRSKERRIIIKS